MPLPARPRAGDQTRLARECLALVTDGRAHFATGQGHERTIDLEFPAVEVRIARRDEQLGGEILKRRRVVRRRC